MGIDKFTTHADSAPAFGIGNQRNPEIESGTRPLVVMQNQERKIQELFSSLIEIKDNYPHHVRHLVAGLRTIRKHNSEALRFGPDYKTQTKSGQELVVHSLFFDNRDSEGLIHRNLALVAQDESGAIVGDRFQRNQADKKLISSGGIIAVGPKGTGISIPIEMAHMDILQMEANNKDLPILWRIIKTNQGDEAESKRWEKIYGAHGILGVDLRGYKILFPENEPQDLELIDQIVLKRTNGPEVYERLKEKRVDETERDSLRAKKIKNFETYTNL